MIRMPWSGSRVPLFAALFFLSVAGCSKESRTGPSSTPSAVRIDGGNQQSGTVGASLPTQLQVTVLDAAGDAVSGTRVDWDVSPGSGSVSASSTTTDSKGQARVVWTLGTVAGANHVSAQVGGVNPAVFTAQALPGAAALVIVSPDVLAMGVGDTLTVHVSTRDSFGNELVGPVVTFSTPDGSVASVSPTGFVTALAVGTARIIATGVKADTVVTTVGPAGSSVCGNQVVQQLAVGQVIKPTATGDNIRVCLGAVGANAEFGLIAFSTGANYATLTPFELFGRGLTTPTSPIVAGITASDALTASAFSAASVAIERANQQSRNASRAEFERRELEARELRPLVADAREAFTIRAKRGAGSFASVQSAQPVPAVGALLSLNAQGLSACGNPDLRTGRVAAVGTSSIAVVDTANPASGYTDADYQSIIATFDTLVYPVDTAYFGTPTNIGGNNRVILFFTKAVNALTPSNANYIIGGFFFARDLYPKTARNGLPGCAGSNETEMFYLLVPDPNGVVNNNKRTKDQVTRQNLVTIGHELQHLINASRRLYITPSAATSEETWLDEGLSHTAEELLYFRISGFGTRDNLTLAQVAGSTATAETFSTYQGQNFSRLYQMLRDPEVNSPYATNDSLATRGATWSFLRYAAGRQNGSEQAFFRALVSSPTTGLANLASALPANQLASYLSDWSVSTFTDDYLLLPQAQLDAAYKVPAWNYRNIFPALKPTGNQPLGVYPLAVRQLGNNVAQRVNLAGGASGYVRFAVPANKSGVISMSANGLAPSSVLNFSVVRVR